MVAFDSPVTKSPGDREQGCDEDGWYVVSDSPLENSNIPRRPRSSTVGALTGEKIRCEFRNNRRTSQGLAVSPSPLAGNGGKSPTFFKGNGESGLVPTSQRNMGSKEQKQHSPMMNM